MKVAILRYNSGNIRSVSFALERIGINPIITDSIDEISSADKVILPGVGEAGSAMKSLKEKNLDKLIVSLKKPVLGICLGLQLLGVHSEEGDTECLGIINQKVKKFNIDLKTPQMGWNNIYSLKSSLFNNIKENEYMYYVHNFYMDVCEDTVSKTDYGITYSSAIIKNNFYGVQFHPEKSGAAGLIFMENFINL